MKKNFGKIKKYLLLVIQAFKGSWLTLLLSSLGAKVIGYSLDPISNKFL